MLKTYNGHAYIFASVGTQHIMGSKTFQLPPGVGGTSVEVIGESRNLTVNGSKQFTDTFPQEYTWHVYRIAL